MKEFDDKKSKDKESNVGVVKSRNSLDFDVKVLRYSLLTYIMYGVFSVFNLGAFVVPLPMVFIIVPVVALIYAVRNQFVYQSIILLLLPVVVLEEIWMGDSPFLMRSLLLLVILVWAIWGSSFLWKNELKKTSKSILMGFSQLFIVLTLVDDIGYYNYLGMILPFIGAVWYYSSNMNNGHIIMDLRIILLIMLIAFLYLITLVSIGSM